MNSDLIKKNTKIIEEALLLIKQSIKGLEVFSKTENWPEELRRKKEDQNRGCPFSFLNYNHSFFSYNARKGAINAFELTESGQFALSEYFRDLKLTESSKNESEGCKDIATLSLDGLLWRIIDGLYQSKLQLTEARKSSDIFNTPDNWTDSELEGKPTEFFNFNNLDPRIIAYRGLEHLKEAQRILSTVQYDIKSWINSNRQAKNEGHA